MNADLQTILASVRCYLGCTPGQSQLIQLGLLRLLVLAANPMAAVDAASLIAQAQLYNFVGQPANALLIYQDALLVQLVQLFNGQTPPVPPVVATPQVLGGTGAPSTNPGVSVALYVQFNSTPPNQVWVWNGSIWQ